MKRISVVLRDGMAGLCLASLSVAAGMDARAAEDSAIHRYAFDGLSKAVYYDAPSPLKDGSRCELAVVLVHGYGGGGEVAGEMAPLMGALKMAVGDAQAAPYVIAPLFPRPQSLKRAKIADDGRAVWNSSWSSNLTRPGVPDDDFRGGGDADGTKISSFEIVDRVLLALGDKARFPNIKRVVVTGFSAGGQFVGRYAAVGKGIVRDGVTVVYAAMSPSTDLLFEPNMIWHYGLKGRPRYAAAVSDGQIMENLSSRRVWHACGSADTNPKGGLDRTPTAMLQGTNRYERFRHFEAHVKKFPGWAKQASFHTFEGLAHNTTGAHTDKAFIDFALGKTK